MEKSKPSRRRGEELLESLYDATIALSSTVKLTQLSFQQIADGANTSRTVLYRRWATPFELLQDVYAYKARKMFDAEFLEQMVDNGSLRADLIQIITLFQSLYSEIGPDILNTYYFLRLQDRDNAYKPAIHQEAVKKYLDAMQSILDNAAKRGEMTNGIGALTLMLPFDLIRIENLIRPMNIDEGRLAMLVDEVLLPVYLKRGNIIPVG